VSLMTYHDFGSTLPIQRMNNRFFDKESFETLISPVLVKVNKLSPFALYLHRLKGGGSEMVKELLSIVVIILSIVMLVLSRH